MLDHITKLIRVATGFTIDVGSQILTQGEKHDMERRLLRGGASPETTSTISVYEQASSMLNSK